MSAMKILAHIRTEEVPGGYQITMETDDGQVTRVFATENQVSDLADELDELLDDDEVEFTPEQKHVDEEELS
ncbi:hypothetical protein [Methylobacterium durans]|uniref:Uncharacterized protein n=1 Tax=Methylobacterium durans TaxID=2202825 RepID=A0A2U8WCI7_9HYPH|nr:hypothetical protein [Methylobacterium durans]AWN43779.1 hypothetical protein DK389_28765 [Methylobacterium durans]